MFRFDPNSPMKEQLQKDLAGIRATKLAADGSSTVTNPRAVIVLRNESKTDQLAFSDPLNGVRNSRGGYTEEYHYRPTDFELFRGKPSLWNPETWRLFVVGHTHPTGRSQAPQFSAYDITAARQLRVRIYKNNAQSMHLFDRLLPNGKMTRLTESGTDQGPDPNWN
jgi:hypothetical protein